MVSRPQVLSTLSMGPSTV